MLTRWLGDRLFWTRALRLALPIALQTLLMSSFALVDTLMIGQLGEVPIAAVGMAGQWAWLMNIVIFGISSGAAVFIAQYWGIKDMDGIARAYGMALINSVLVTALFTAVAAFFPRFVLGLFTSDELAISEGLRYLKWACLSYVAIGLTGCFSTVLRSTEEVRLPVYASVVSVALNAFFNYVLIFGALGFPALGVEGAAIATAISAWVSPIVLWGISFAKKNVLIVPVKKLLHFTKPFVKDFFIMSMPVLANESLWALGTMGYNMVYGHMGTGYYSALTIFRTVEFIAFAFFVGLCHASSVMIGKDVGAGRLREAVANARRFGLVVPLLAVAVGLSMVLLRAPIISLFNLTDEVRYTAMVLLVIYGLEMPLRNIPYINIVGIFRSGGDTRTGMFYDILCVWGIALPLTAVLGLVVKVPFLWVVALMLISEDVVKTWLCLRHFRSQKWIRPVTDEGRLALHALSHAKEKT